MYLNAVKARLEELRSVRLDKILSCTEEEVSILEQKIGRFLPAAYREFLLWMGRGTGGLFQGSECLYWDVIPLQKAAADLMQEDEFSGPFPEDAFVLLMHQGYQFHFFRTSEGDDPPVYHYLEGQEESSMKLVYSHFSDFLLAMVENHARISRYIASLHPDRPKDDNEKNDS